MTACHNRQELFFDTRPSSIRLAVELCESCPVLKSCREDTDKLLAEGQPVAGVWAGVHYTQKGLEGWQPKASEDLSGVQSQILELMREGLDRFQTAKRMGLTTAEVGQSLAPLGGWKVVSVQLRKEAATRLSRQGWSARQIADRLGVHLGTVYNDLKVGA